MCNNCKEMSDFIQRTNDMFLQGLNSRKRDHINREQAARSIKTTGFESENRLISRIKKETKGSSFTLF